MKQLGAITAGYLSTAKARRGRSQRFFFFFFFAHPFFPAVEPLLRTGTWPYVVIVVVTQLN